MRIDIERVSSGFKFEYTYTVDGKSLYRGTARRTLWSFLRKAAIESLEGEPMATVAQENLIGWIAEKIPYFFGCPFVLRRGGTETGRLRGWPNLRQYECRGRVGESEIRIYGHRGTTYSVFRWPEQIGLIDREVKSVGDGGRYHADFDNDLDPLLCACIVLFVDAAWHMSDGMQFSSVSWEWNWQLGGVSRNPDWRPKGEPRDHGGTPIAPGTRSFGSPARASSKWVPKLLGWLFATIAAGLLITCVASIFYTREFIAVADRSEGVVTQLVRERGDKGSILYRAVFAFRDSNQRMHEVRSGVASNPPAHQVGDRVTMLYRAADPDGAVTDAFGDVWFLSLLTGLLGAGFSLPAVILLLLGYLK